MTEKKLFSNSCESLVFRRAGRWTTNGEVRRPLPDLVINTLRSNNNTTTTTTATTANDSTARPTSTNGCNGLNSATTSLPSLPSPSDLDYEPGTPLIPPPSPFLIGIKLRRISLNFDEARPARRRSSALF